MKTLEDVIKAYECKKSIEDECNKCPYFYECDNKYHCECEARDNDALYYLQKYRDLKSTMDWHVQMDEIRDSIENVPLTWDKLKTMEGKPVWIEDKNCYSRWEIITSVYDDGISFGDYFLSKNEFDTMWQAYRREKK